MKKVERPVGIKVFLLLFLAFFLLAIAPSLQALGQDDVNSLIKQGKDLYENGDYDKAILKYFEALDQTPNQQQEADIRFYLALSYFASAQNGKMKEQLEKLFVLQPDRKIDIAMYPPDFVEAFMAEKYGSSHQVKTASADKKENTAVAEKQIIKTPEKVAAQVTNQVWMDPTTGMEFVWVPGGEFDMGSNSGNSDERPVHKVAVSGFWMGKYEVTQGQWHKIMGSNPSFYDKDVNCPVEQVSWHDVQNFVIKVNSRTGERFRLPTEAEWEYACRGGDVNERYGNLGDIAWTYENSDGYNHIVGLKKKNAFGLYDILGNIWEWCQDWYGPYPISADKNPKGPERGSKRVIRGGSRYSHSENVRAAKRDSRLPSEKFDYLGFRLVRIK